MSATLELPEIEVHEVPGLAEQSAHAGEFVVATKLDSHQRLEPLFQPTRAFIAWARHRSMTRSITPNPRHHSRVAHRVVLWHHSLRTRLDSIPLDVNHQLRCTDDGFEFDDFNGYFRRRAALPIRFSYPVPVWLIVEKWSGEQSVLGLELRSSWRPHYPTRYFHAAHAALDELERLALKAPGSTRRPDDRGFDGRCVGYD
jgi:hypothetical protein